MATKDFISKLDWDSAIAEATRKIEALKSLKKNSAVIEDWGNETITLPLEYLYSGIARCFKADKEGKHSEAIADLSNALAGKVSNEADAYYYRAFAYYLDGNYERAIADCTQCKNDCKKCKFPQNCELLGKIYMAMSKYQKAAENFGNALKHYYQKNPCLPPPPSLLHDYIESCKRMNSV